MAEVGYATSLMRAALHRNDGGDGGVCTRCDMVNVNFLRLSIQKAKGTFTLDSLRGMEVRCTDHPAIKAEDRAVAAEELDLDLANLGDDRQVVPRHSAPLVSQVDVAGSACRLVMLPL